jgi:hypothetical protein
MTLNKPQDYTVEIVDGIRYAIRAGGAVCSFTAPATTRGLAKLYTVSRSGALLYVGIAEQPMSARLKFGFKASGKGGYHGYKWKHLTERLALSVWTAHGEAEPVAVREMETVEAEVAFLCRLESHQWPAFQHEIHFHASTQAHRAAAKTIYEHAIRTVS